MIQITTILPTFKRPRLLARAIKSVLAQTYPHFRVIVCDNASGDDTPEVVAKYSKSDSRVIYRRRLTNIGAFENFNAGIRDVETPYFNLLSDDDALFPEFFARAIEGLGKCADAGIYCGATVWVTEPSEEIRDVPMARIPSGFYPPFDALIAFLSDDFSDWMGTLFRTEAVKAVGGLDESSGNAIDLDLLCQCAKNFSTLVDHRLSAIYTLREDTETSRDFSIALYWRNLSYVLDKQMRTAHPLQRGLIRAAKRRLAWKMLRGALGLAAGGVTRDVDAAVEAVSSVGIRGAGAFRIIGSPGIAGRLSRRVLSGLYRTRKPVVNATRNNRYRTLQPEVSRILRMPEAETFAGLS